MPRVSFTHESPPPSRPFVWYSALGEEEPLWCITAAMMILWPNLYNIFNLWAPIKSPTGPIKSTLQELWQLKKNSRSGEIFVCCCSTDCLCITVFNPHIHSSPVLPYLPSLLRGALGGGMRNGSLGVPYSCFVILPFTSCLTMTEDPPVTECAEYKESAE